MIEFEKPNIECLEVDDTNNYAMQNLYVNH